MPSGSVHHSKGRQTASHIGWHTEFLFYKTETTSLCSSLLMSEESREVNRWLCVCVWGRAIWWSVLGLPNWQSCEQNGLWNRQQCYRQTVERLEFRTPPPSAGLFFCQKKITSLQSRGGDYQRAAHRHTVHTEAAIYIECTLCNLSICTLTNTHTQHLTQCYKSKPLNYCLADLLITPKAASLCLDSGYYWLKEKWLAANKFIFLSSNSVSRLLSVYDTSSSPGLCL